VAADLWTKLTSLGLWLKQAHLQAASKSYSSLWFIIIIMQPKSWYSFYWPTEDRRLSRPRWLLHTEMVYLRWSPFQVLSGPGVEQLSLMCPTTLPLRQTATSSKSDHSFWTWCLWRQCWWVWEAVTEQACPADSRSKHQSYVTSLKTEGRVEQTYRSLSLRTSDLVISAWNTSPFCLHNTVIIASH